MLSRFLDLNDIFLMMDAFERQMSSALNEGGRANKWPELSLKGGGDKLTLVASVPGITKDDLDISIEGELLTLKAERKLDVPKEYKLVRRERGALHLLRQIDLGVPVQADAVEATLEDGILTVTLPKAPEAKPRKIAIGGRAAPPAIGSN